MQVHKQNFDERLEQEKRQLTSIQAEFQETKVELEEKSI